MSKSPQNIVRFEQWTVRDPQNRYGNGRMVVTKVAVRNAKGQLHGATNFRGTMLAK